MIYMICFEWHVLTLKRVSVVVVPALMVHFDRTEVGSFAHQDLRQRLNSLDCYLEDTSVI